MTLRNFARLAIAGSAFAFLASSALADGIGASLLTQQHPFYIELANAMKSEATAKNVKLEVAIANQDLNMQLADVEDFIVKGVDVTSYIGTDNYAGGVKAGELMAKVLGDKGEVAIIDYPTVQSVVNRIDGFKKAIGEHKDIKIVAQQTGITRAEALAAAQNMLQANPDIDGIFGFGDDAALAAAVAVKSAGLEKQVKVIGFDGMEEARHAVDTNPVMVGVIQQFPDKMGKQAVDTAVDVIAGKTVPTEQPIEPGVYVRT